MLKSTFIEDAMLSIRALAQARLDELHRMPTSSSILSIDGRYASRNLILEILYSLHCSCMHLIHFARNAGAGEPSAIRGRMTTGYETFSGISSDGGLYIWGSDLVDDSVPILEPKLLDEGPWLQVGVGLRFMCALKETDKNIYCTGEGSSGQLGDGGPIGEESSVP